MLMKITVFVLRFVTNLEPMTRLRKYLPLKSYYLNQDETSNEVVQMKHALTSLIFYFFETQF